MSFSTPLYITYYVIYITYVTFVNKNEREIYSHLRQLSKFLRNNTKTDFVRYDLLSNLTILIQCKLKCKFTTMENYSCNLNNCFQMTVSYNILCFFFLVIEAIKYDT